MRPVLTPLVPQVLSATPSLSNFLQEKAYDASTVGSVNKLALSAIR